MVNWTDVAFNLYPHGYCLSWQPGLLWLHAGADAVVALSYFAIPALLLRFVLQRTDLQFSWMFVLFGVFILACGGTHVMNLWTMGRALPALPRAAQRSCPLIAALKKSARDLNAQMQKSPWHLFSKRNLFGFGEGDDARRRGGR